MNVQKKARDNRKAPNQVLPVDRNSFHTKKALL